MTIYFVNLLLLLNSFAAWMSDWCLYTVVCGLGILNMKKFIAIVLTMSTLGAPAFAISSTADNKNKTLTAAFVQKQVDQSMSIGRAVKSIIGHYPQDAEVVVSTALDLYPEKYKEIIHAAISAEPALTEAVVTIAIGKGIHSCASIVETAINAEPSYVDFVVRAAANATPEELHEIVRIAVLTEPDSADSIVQTLSQSHPNKMVDILQTAIGAVPFVGEYMVDALLAIFPNKAENVVTTAVRESTEQKDYVKRILETAKNAGVGQADLETYAKNAGASDEEMAQLMEERP